MSMTTYPLALPKELLEQVKEVARETGISMADAMRLSLQRGLPQLRQALSREEDFSEAIADTWEKIGPAPRVNYDAIEEG